MEGETFPMVANHGQLLADPSKMIFVIITNFIQATEKTKRSPELGGFPEKLEAIQWRRLYKLLDADNIVYQAMTHWDASELPYGGTGSMWFFTELQRSGDNVSRKTDNGQSWSGKSGRLTKKGYPDDILVAKLVLNKEFHMLEHTLKIQQQPTVALCKIWRKGNSTVASPHTPNPTTVFSPGASASSPQTPIPNIIFSPGAATSQQVPEGHFVFCGVTGRMQIDQPQGQMEGTEQQHLFGPSQQVLEDHFLIPGGVTAMQIDQPQGSFHRSTGKEAESTGYEDLSLLITKIEDALSFLHDVNKKGLFEQLASFSGDKAQEITSSAHNLASYYINVMGTRATIGEEESSMPRTWNSEQLTEAALVTNNAAELAADPGTAAQDDFPAADEELDALPMEDFNVGGSFFYVEEFIIPDDGDGNMPS